MHGDRFRVLVEAVFDGQRIAFVLARREGLFEPAFMGADVAHSNTGGREKRFAHFDEGRNGVGQAPDREREVALLQHGGRHDVDVAGGRGQTNEGMGVPHHQTFTLSVAEALFHLNV